mmetsp:Transcript_19160/g.56576  ORF Transcript_19160/g.56576 Transcript_19160/m.56576 type:complete len:327 (+) Transcript_19160:388-1368(+)
MELLKAHQSRDAEASRLQQALQCQEEADAAKLVELMRRQEAASAAAVEEAKAAIEAQLVERFREEQAAAAEAHSAQLQQLSAEHSTQLQQAAALLEAQAREKFETAVAHERVIGAGGARREAGVSLRPQAARARRRRAHTRPGAYCILDAELSDVIVFAAPRSTPAAARARPRATPFAQQHLKLLGPPNSGRSVGRSGVGPEFENGDGRLRPSSNIASPAQRGPRRDAQPLHATPLAAARPERLRLRRLAAPRAGRRHKTCTCTWDPRPAPQPFFLLCCSPVPPQPPRMLRVGQYSSAERWDASCRSLRRQPRQPPRQPPRPRPPQ